MKTSSVQCRTYDQGLVVLYIRIGFPMHKSTEHIFVRDTAAAANPATQVLVDEVE